MSSMKTRTEYTYERLVELQRVVSKTLAPRQTLRRKAGNLAWGGCFLLIGAYMSTNGYNAIIAMVLLVLGGILMARYLFFYQVLARSASSRMKNDQRINDFYFESDHILVRQKNSSAKYPYKKCSQLLETANGFYFIMEDGQGLLLDKQNLLGGSVDELRRFLEQKTRKTVQTVKIKKELV